MKKTIQFLAIFTLVFSFVSCDEISDATSTTFNTTQSATIPVSVSAGDDLPINESIGIDIDNSDTHAYLNLIKKVTINQLTYKIINFTGDANGTIDVNIIADGVVIASHELPVKTTADNGVEFEVTNTTYLNTIASKLKNGNEVVFSINGTSSSDGAMNFKVQINIDLKVTAGIL
jgi:hypothetical protein